MIEFTMPEFFVNLYWRMRRFYWKKKPNIWKAKTSLKHYLSDKKEDFRAFFFGAVEKTRNQLTHYFRKTKEASLSAYWKLQKAGRKHWLLATPKQKFYAIRAQLNEQLNKQLNNLYWRVKNSGVLYPFVKSYWFLSYQMHKRVLSLYKKINKN